jgi:hypothetical protein
MRPPRSHLRLETLEDRCVPTVFGTAWPDSTLLTLSFPADGTAVGSQANRLFQALNQAGATRDWQLAVLRAFQTWAVNANVNIGLIPDGGQALGSLGAVQGDERFGDIRIAAHPLDQTAIAVGVPFDVTAGTWSGDVTLNTNYAFRLNAAADQFDLFTVMLHEAGHVFGVGPSTDPTSAMFQQYQGVRGGLRQGDITSLQALYGPRKPDAADAHEANDNFHDATDLKLAKGAGGIESGWAIGDITTLNDVDIFEVNTPSDVETLRITLRTAGISLLTPRLTLYDDEFQEVGSAVATDPLTGELVLDNADPDGHRMYIRVVGATDDVFGIGGYELHVSASTDDVEEDDDYLNDDGGSDDDFQTANLLPQQYVRTDSRFDYAYKASISAVGDVDFYRVRAPQAVGAQTMTVMTWGLQADALLPQVQVFNQRMKPVPFEIVVNDNGAYTVQLVGAKSDKDYFVAVQAANPNLRNLGDYFVGIDFSFQPVQPRGLEQGKLTAASRQVVRTLDVKQSQILQFSLSAKGGNTGVESGVRVTIYDLAGNVIHTMVASAGTTQTRTLLLAPGKYAIHFAGGTRNRSSLDKLKYTFRVHSLTDPIGPQPIDTTLQPPSTPPPPTDGPLTVWEQYGLYAFISLTGPYSAPW